jgi:hypothetical protein
LTQGFIWGENISQGFNKVINISSGNLNISMAAGQEYFFYLTAETNSNAVLGRTIQVTSCQPKLSGSFPTLVNELSIGATVTIGSPIVSVSSQNMPNFVVSRASYNNIIYGMELNSSGAVNIDSLILQMAGNYTRTDVSFSAWLSPDSILDDNLDNQFLSNAGFSAGSGKSLKIYYNLTIPAGRSYIFLTIETSDTAKIGHNLFVAGGSLYLNSASVSGVLGLGPEVTIVQPSVTIFTVTVPAINLPTTSDNQLVYAFGLYVEGGPVNLNSMSLNIGGNFSASDFNDASLYTNTTGSFNPKTNTSSPLNSPKPGTNVFTI